MPVVEASQEMEAWVSLGVKQRLVFSFFHLFYVWGIFLSGPMFFPFLFKTFLVFIAFLFFFAFVLAFWFFVYVSFFRRLFMSSTCSLELTI